MNNICRNRQRISVSRTAWRFACTTCAVSPKGIQGVRFLQCQREEVDSCGRQQESALNAECRFDSQNSTRLCAVSNIIKQLPQKLSLAAQNHARISVLFVSLEG
jgi:hypothetical protein